MWKAVGITLAIVAVVAVVIFVGAMVLGALSSFHFG